MLLKLLLNNIFKLYFISLFLSSHMLFLYSWTVVILPPYSCHVVTVHLQYDNCTVAAKDIIGSCYKYPYKSMR